MTWTHLLFAAAGAALCWLVWWRRTEAVRIEREQHESRIDHLERCLEDTRSDAEKLRRDIAYRDGYKDGQSGKEESRYFGEDELMQFRTAYNAHGGAGVRTTAKHLMQDWGR